MPCFNLFDNDHAMHAPPLQGWSPLFSELHVNLSFSQAFSHKTLTSSKVVILSVFSCIISLKLFISTVTISFLVEALQPQGSKSDSLHPSTP